MSARNILENPFPIEKLKLLQFGNADGRKDKELESVFVKTTSIKQFLQNNHSVIVGPMGSGKSALFKLLKEQSDLLPEYKNYIIVSIQENISFNKLKILLKDTSVLGDEKQLYQFIWKFQIVLNITEKISNFNDFPLSSNEKDINKFLKIINSKEYDESVIGKIGGLIKSAALTIKTKISGTPISVESSIELKDKANKDEINLDKILRQCEEILKEREKNNFLIIIDRIDAFVSGEEYDVQRKYIEALLEVDDDLDCAFTKINCKIFLRSDLFARLNFEVLGSDKVNDNTLKIKWDKKELIYFISHRMLNALNKENILNLNQVFYSTNLDGYNINVNWFKKIIIEKAPEWVQRLTIDFKSLKEERNASLLEKIAKSIVTKVFPRKINHKNKQCEECEIEIFEFLETHFLNGHKEIAPRTILIFLKELNNAAVTYYNENPDQIIEVQEQNGDFEWKLYKKKFLYKAYINSHKEFIRNISKVDNKWTKYFATFLRERKNKEVFDYNWIKNITGLLDEDTESFLAYLEYIGFVYISHNSPDTKKRKYKLPVIYMSQCNKNI